MDRITRDNRLERVTQAVVLIAVLCALILAAPVSTEAGFGITPPYVASDRLTRGTVYEQRIGLVRSDSAGDLKVEITMNIPGVEHWFTVDRGKEFIIPDGVQSFPIVVQVTVPPDAEYRTYSGAIRVRTSPVERGPTAGVSIALGAQIDVRVKVVDKIYDFNVRKIGVGDLEAGRTRWGFYFPGKIRFMMTVENTGNAEYGPSKVRFEIFDSEKETLLETTENTNELPLIPAFSIRDIVAEIPTRLPAGRYVARYSIYMGDEINSQNDINLSILPLGSVPGYEGYGFWGLAFEDKIKIALMVGVPLVLLFILIGIIVSRRKRKMRKRRARTVVHPNTTQVR